VTPLTVQAIRGSSMPDMFVTTSSRISVHNISTVGPSPPSLIPMRTPQVNFLVIQACLIAPNDPEDPVPQDDIPNPDVSGPDDQSFVMKTFMVVNVNYVK
ncbi:7215_t:CDS:2, partial [Acaulospora colombiana]